MGSHDEILLSDFSTAIVSHMAASHTTQELVGTCDYAAPEQFQGNACPASDQYSLAVVVYEWLCGTRPFLGESSIEIALKHLSSPPVPLRQHNSAISVETERVVLKALSKEPKQRFKTVKDFALALEKSCSQATQASPSIRQTPARPSSPRQTVDFSPPQMLSPVLLLSSSPSPFWRLLPSPKALMRLLTVLLLVLILLSAFSVSRYVSLLHQQADLTTLQASHMSNGLGVKGPQHVGISDGSFAFDSQRADGPLKVQATQKVKQGDLVAAIALLRQAVQVDSSDAEAQIYLENLLVEQSRRPYITFVVGTMLSSDALGLGRDDLQGAYVAQKEFNEGFKLYRATQARLFIANTGNDDGTVVEVAQHVVQLAHADPTFAGVMGWPYSSSTTLAIPIFNQAQIPLVSQSATSDTLTGASPYFFRVASSNKAQAQAGSQYASQVLHAKRAALFFDPADPYSQSLAKDFVLQFQHAGNTIVAAEQYTVGKPEDLPHLLHDALQNTPDVLYFAGYADDLGILLTNLPPGNLPVLGGDGLYDLWGYPISARAGFSHLHFTALAYPDEWDILGHPTIKPSFFTTYAMVFDPNHTHQGSPYGFTRPNDSVIMSYDALSVLLKSADTALSQHPQQKTITPEQLRQALTQIKDENGFQGVSGCIAFAADGNPLEKTFVILSVDGEGHIRMESQPLGRFLC